MHCTNTKTTLRRRPFASGGEAACVGNHKHMSFAGHSSMQKTAALMASLLPCRNSSVLAVFAFLICQSSDHRSERVKTSCQQINNFATVKKTNYRKIRRCLSACVDSFFKHFHGLLNCSCQGAGMSSQVPRICIPPWAGGTMTRSTPHQFTGVGGWEKNTPHTIKSV